MIVFVDESGDPGLKIGKGSSEYFIVILVVFNEDDEAAAAEQRISLLKRELGLSSWYEFRFNKCNKQLRIFFLSAIKDYSFFYYGIIINKRKLYGDGFKVKESFHKYVTRLVFENAKDKLSNATVVIDGSGTRDFRSNLQKYLKNRINTTKDRYIYKIKVQDSKQNNLLQLADMIAGAVHRSLAEKHDSFEYREIIKHREVYVQYWPK